MNKKNIIAIIIIIVLIGIVGFFIIHKIDMNKRIYKIEEISEYKFFVVKSEDKYGVIDNSGKKIIETKYDKVDIPNPSKDIFICYKDEKGIVINSDNQQLFADYDSVEAIELKNGTTSLPYEKSTLKFKKNSKYGLIDLTGKIILKAKFDNIESFSGIEGQLQIKQNDKIGIVNINGKILVNPDYDTIISDKYFNDEIQFEQSGYVVGQKSEDGYKYGYVNNQGKLKLKIEYNDISRITDIPYKDGVYLIAAKNGQYGVIKDNKNIIENEYQNIEYDNTNCIFIIQKGRNYGVADIYGKIIIPVQNTNIQAKGKYIYVERNNIQQVYDAAGNTVDINFNTYIMPTTNENYKILINLDDNRNYYGVLNANNKQIIKPEYLYIEYAFDDYFIACGKDGKLGIIDSKQNIVIELKYDLVQKIQGKEMIQTLDKDDNLTEVYSKDMKKICDMENATIDNQNNYIKVYSNRDLHYYNNEGKEVSSSELFPNGKLYAVVDNGKWGYVDNNKRMKVEFEYDFATEVNQYGFASIKKDGKWGCIDSNGRIVVEPKFELNENYNKVEFIGEYIKVDNGFGSQYYTNDI